MTLYFAQAGHYGPYKIGFTSGDVHVRLRALRATSGLPMVLRGVAPGDREAEKALHWRLRDYRVRDQALGREWFVNSPTVKAVLKPILQPVPEKPVHKRNTSGLARISRSSGRAGGLAKAAKAAQARELAMPREQVVELVKRVSFHKAAEILGPPFSKATLRRHYKP